MKKKILHIICTLALLIIGSQAIAQTFPVQVIPQVTPPPPVYLSDYANASNSVDRIKTTLLLTDLTVFNRQVRLKLYLEGNGINAQSRDFVIGAQPIFLDGGIPVQLGNIDLAPYFELQNLQGISAGAYANTLPEGLYQFCFEVYDVISGNIISKKSCANVLIFLNEPPFLNLPQNNINLEAMNPQNLLFQWTPRHINVTNVEYVFSLVEIWDFNMDPQAVFLSSPPIYEITTQATSFLYGVAEPQLLEGKRYAWRVRAKAKDGIDEIGLFSNNGFSEIFAFTYQGECAEPTYLSVEEVGTKTATFRWQGDIDNLNYRIGYRKAIDEDGNTDTANTFQWFENDTSREEYMVIDLEPDTMYEWRVGGYCADGTLTYAPTTTFTTMNVDAEAYYNCGIEPTIDIANQTLLETIQVGDVIKAGDFNVKIQEVDGTNSFSGKGYTTVGFLKNIKIALVFTNIQVNTSYQFVSGEIKTVYDPTWSNILDIDEVIDEFEDLVDVVAGDDQVVITVDFDIDEDDINVDTDAGQIIITDPVTGETSTHNYDSGDTYTITDASGDEYSIDADGNVTQTGTGAEGGPATAENTNGITNGYNHTVGSESVQTIDGKGIFISYSKIPNSETPTTKYELDNANNDYENEKYHKVTVNGGADYYPAHKAVADGDSDVFYADITSSNNTINLDSLIFKTVAGKKIEAEKEGNRYTITVNGNNHYKNEEAIITYKDTLGKQQVLSSFFIHHIKKQPEIKVQVVLVNDAQDISNLQSRLNEIFAPAAGNFKVVGASQEIQIPEAAWDVDEDNSKIDYNGSGIASDYPKELRAIKDFYKDKFKSFDSKTYNIFVLDDSMPVTKALQGFMPKTRQWGFLFEAHLQSTDAIEKKQDIATVAAHELGHGVYSLGHPFGENTDNSGKADTWLMDYENGIELAYPNWAKMSDKGLDLGLFQDDEDNEIAKKTWFTPDWKHFSVTNTNTIYVGDISEHHVQGTVPGFNLNNKTYKAIYDDAGKFKHYESSSAGIYTITETSQLKNDSEVYLFQDNQECGKHKYYKSNFEYVSNHKESIDFENENVTDGKVVPCSFDIEDLCADGKEYFNSYKSITNNKIEDFYLFKVAKLICDADTDELIAAQKAQYEAWKNKASTLAVALNDPFTFEKYHEALIKFSEWRENGITKVLDSNPNKDTLREKLFEIAYRIDERVLALISLEQKIEMLTIMLDGNLFNLFSNKNHDALVVKVIKSVNDDEAEQFITALESSTHKNTDGNPLIFVLKEKLSDFLNSQNPYTLLFGEIKRLSDARNKLSDEKLDIKVFLKWDVEQKDYVLVSFVKNRNDYRFIYNQLTHTVSIETCKEYDYTYNSKTDSLVKTCKEEVELLSRGSSPFDLVGLTIINDVSPFGSGCQNGSGLNEVCGEVQIVPALFLDYLQTKENSQRLTNFGWNSFNVIITIATFGEGAVAISAVRTAAVGQRLAVASKNAYALIDFTYSVSDIALDAFGVDKPVAWKWVGYAFAAKSSYDLISKGGAKGIGYLRKLLNANNKDEIAEIVKELKIKKSGDEISMDNVEEFVQKAETKINSSNDPEIKRQYEEGLNGVSPENTIKFSKAIIKQKRGFVDQINTLLKEEGLTIDDFHYMMQKTTNSLTELEVQKMSRIREALPKPIATSVMQKVITKNDISKYLNGERGVNVGGYVTKGADAKHLNSYEDIYQGLRLDYTGSKFSISDESCGVIRFKSSQTKTSVIPSGGTYAKYDYPFTNHGFTAGKSGRLGSPEYHLPNEIEMVEGAEIWEVFNDGTEILKGRLVDGKFIKAN